MKHALSTFVSMGTLALALFGASAFAETASPEPNKLAIGTITPKGVAEGWVAAGQKEGKDSVQFEPSDKDNPFATINFKISGSDGDKGVYAVSPQIPVKYGTELKLSYQWKGKGLYDSFKDGNRIVCVGKLEFQFFGGTPVRFLNTGAMRLYFKPSDEFKSEDVGIPVPAEASYCAFKFTFSRLGESTGEDSTFVIGDLKLIEQ